MICFLLFAGFGVLVYGVPHPIAPAGIPAGVPCATRRYETTNVVNVTAEDPNDWTLVNVGECVTTSASCKPAQPCHNYHLRTNTKAHSLLPNE